MANARPCSGTPRPRPVSVPPETWLPVTSDYPNVNVQVRAGGIRVAAALVPTSDIDARRSFTSLRSGRLVMLDTENALVLTYARVSVDGNAMVVSLNMSATPKHQRGSGGRRPSRPPPGDATVQSCTDPGDRCRQTADAGALRGMGRARARPAHASPYSATEQRAPMNFARLRVPRAAICVGALVHPGATPAPRLPGTTRRSLVAARGDIRDLPRSFRTPTATASEISAASPSGSTTSRSWAWMPSGCAAVSLTPGRFRIRHLRLPVRRPTVRHARRFRSTGRRGARRHIRVILDMVLNHTSEQHPWFSRLPLAHRCEA